MTEKFDVLNELGEFLGETASKRVIAVYFPFLVSLFN